MVSIAYVSRATWVSVPSANAPRLPGVLIPSEHLVAVTSSRMRRRMIRLPVGTYRLKVGHAYKLQAQRGVGGVVVTVTEVREEPLADLTVGDARREGFGTVQGALGAWERWHGKPARDQRVQVVSFVLGDESAFFRGTDTPVYLSKYRDYTIFASRQAVKGDPEVMLVPGSGERARVMALAERQAPQAQAITRLRDQVSELKQAMLGMKARSRMRLIERELGKILDEMPVQSLGVSGVDAASLDAI